MDGACSPRHPSAPIPVAVSAHPRHAAAWRHGATGQVIAACLLALYLHAPHPALAESADSRADGPADREDASAPLSGAADSRKDGDTSTPRAEAGPDESPVQATLDAAPLLAAPALTGVAFELSERFARPAPYLREVSARHAALWDAARAFYEARRFQPAWTQDTGLNEAGQQAVRVLAQAPRHGLLANAYQQAEIRALADDLGDLDGDDAERTRVDLEALLTSAVMAHGSDLLDGRLDPAELSQDWHIRPPERNWPEKLAHMVATGDLEQAFAALAPNHRQYRELQRILAALPAAEKDAELPRVAPGRMLRRGHRGERVAAVAEILRVTGDLPPGEPLSVYTTQLEAAVRSFQARFGLRPDGVIGAKTIAVLNAPYRTLHEKVTINLDRWRWLPSDLGTRYILVNVPAFHLSVFDAEDVILDMRVIVGGEGNETPLFSDRVDYLVFHPYWNVPRRISLREFLPKLRADPFALESRGFEVLRGSTVVDPGSIDWTEISDSGFRYRLRQKPGNRNSLGQIKFMFPNEFAIYLHDTPAHHLFRRTERDFSHGCIRLERPAELAALLTGDGARVQRLLAAGKNRTVTLEENRKLPVYIIYLTARIGADDRLQLSPDLYNRDAILAAALDTGTAPGSLH